MYESELRCPATMTGPCVVGPDALLPGEDRGGLGLDDAVHWATVYAELTRFLSSLNGGGTAMTATLGRYRRRLHYWSARHAELAALGAARPAARAGT